MRLIDADKLVRDIESFNRPLCDDYHMKDYVLDQILTDIRNAPTIDAVPVRYGRWLWLDGVRCSQCNCKQDCHHTAQTAERGWIKMGNDLISRQEAIAWVNNILDVIRYYHPHSKSRNVPIDNVIDALERVPSEDAVPVIRCKDCKYWLTALSGDAAKNGFCVRDVTYGRLRKSEGFCSDAKRKEK